MTIKIITSICYLKSMNEKIVLAAVFVALSLGLSPTLFNVPMASADDDPRSDRACEEMVRLEGSQDARTEPDSSIPDNDIGSWKAFEGSLKAMGNC
jgi:hypothetical protein